MSSTHYVACTRMYNVSECVADLWEQLLTTASVMGGVPLRVERHPFPQNILDLWARPDLGLVFICGRAFMLGGMRHKPIAVPLRKQCNGGTSPCYSTYLLVSEDSAILRCEDILTARVGWTVPHSLSGYLAVKRLLVTTTGDDGADIEVTGNGPLHTPMNCLTALRENKADVIPLDSYCYDLINHNAPELLAGIRILTTTPEYPMPFLAASSTVEDSVCEALRHGLYDAANMPSMAPILEALCITGFTEPKITQYATLVEPEEFSG